MPPIRAALMSLVVLSGCGAFGAVSDATAPMDAYTLSPYVPKSAQTSGSRHLVVELPTSSGALRTDRILIKPLPFQAEYLPDGQWSEAAPALVQTLLVASFQNAGGFRLVGRDGAGLMPDVTLMTELQAFQVEPSGADPAAFAVRVSVMMTLIRETDQRILASRRLETIEAGLSDDTLVMVGGFDRALQSVLQQAVQWTRAQAG